MLNSLNLSIRKKGGMGSWDKQNQFNRENTVKIS